MVAEIECQINKTRHKMQGTINVNGELVEQRSTCSSGPDGSPVVSTDGGWGWFIVISSLVIHLIVAGLNRAAGILYLRFTEQFDKPASVTAWVTSLSVSLTLGVGPIASALCDRFSYRKVVVSGGFILGTSMVISAMSPNLYVLFASYGVLGGIGKAFAYGPGVVIVGLYFKRRRGLAIGLATSGVALGAFALPSIVEISFSQYGYFGAFLIMTGIALQMIVCGFLLRPFSLQARVLDYERTRKTMVKNQSGRRVTGQIGVNGSNPGQDDKYTIQVRTHDCLKTLTETLEMKTNKKEENNIKESQRFKNNKKFDIHLLKNIRFFGLCIAVLFFNVAFQSAMIFLPALSEPVGIGHFEAFPVVVVGVCDGLGRIISGFLFDRKCIVPVRIYCYNFAIFALGAVTFLVPFVRTPVQLGVVCVVFGLFLGNGVSQQSVVIIDILGEQNLFCGFGILLFFQGIGTFVGPPISGLMKDIKGTYDYAFYLGAVCAVIGATVLFGASIVHKKIQKNIYIVSSTKTPYDRTQA